MMGIDTTIRHQEFHLNKEWITKNGNKFLKAWKEECEKDSDLDNYWSDIDYHEGGDISLSEWYGKRYEHDKFGEAIAKYLSYGFLEMETEGEIWAMEWNDFGYKEMAATILWDPDYYELFLDNYGDKLTDEVKEQISLCVGADRL